MITKRELNLVLTQDFSKYDQRFKFTALVTKEGKFITGAEMEFRFWEALKNAADKDYHQALKMLDTGCQPLLHDPRVPLTRRQHGTKSMPLMMPESTRSGNPHKEV